MECGFFFFSLSHFGSESLNSKCFDQLCFQKRVTKYSCVLFSVGKVKKMQCFDSDPSADCRVYLVSG